MDFPLKFGLHKTGLPLIVTSGKLKNLCFLIDTGATNNILFTYVYEHFKDEFRVLEEMQKIMGIEGKYKETRSHTDGFQRNNAKCLDEKGISRFVPHSSI